MANIDFPNSPVAGNTYLFDGITFTYHTGGYWYIAQAGDLDVQEFVRRDTDNTYDADTTQNFQNITATSINGMLGERQVFATAGTTTWVKPVGVTKLKITVTGAGGGGSAGSWRYDGLDVLGYVAAGGHGKPGVTNVGYMDVGSAAQSFDVVVGAGGLGQAEMLNNGGGTRPSNAGGGEASKFTDVGDAGVGYVYALGGTRGNYCHLEDDHIDDLTSWPIGASFGTPSLKGSHAIPELTEIRAPSYGASSSHTGILVAFDGNEPAGKVSSLVVRGGATTNGSGIGPGWPGAGGDGKLYITSGGALDAALTKGDAGDTGGDGMIMIEY